MARKIKNSNQTQQTNIQFDTTALYIRVSTDKQVDEGFSLDAQEKKLRAYCEANDWAVDPQHIYIDAGTSGKTADRPQFQAMLQTAKDGSINRIVAMKLDRIARNTRDFLGTVDQLKKFDCHLVLVKESFDTSTPQGQFFLTMTAALAELEVATIQERTMSGRREKAAKGGHNGAQTPLGYSYDGSEFAISHEGETIHTIFDLYIGDDMGLTAIANYLNSQGTKTKRGGKWAAATVRYILSNGFYAGLVQYDGDEVKGSHPAIVAMPTYERAFEKLRNARKGPKPKQ